MRQSFALSILLLAFCAKAQEVPFQLALDPPGNNTFLSYTDAAVFPDGSMVLLSRTDGWGMTPSAAVVTKLDANGTILWSRNVQPTSTSMPYAPTRVLAMPSGDVGVFSVGMDPLGYTSSYTMVRFDGNGDLEWSKHFVPSTGVYDFDYGYSSARPAADDGIIMNLGLTATPTFVRLAPDGSTVWSRSFITDDPDTSKVPTFDFGITENGGIIMTEKANSDMMMILTDGTGQVMWSHRYATGLYTHTKSAIELSNGDFLCSGYSNGPFAARLDPFGNVIWMRAYEMTGIWDGFHHMVELSNGDILLSGRANSGFGMMTSSEVCLRVNSNGAPVGKVEMNGITNAAMEVVGLYDDMVVIGGQAIAPVAGGYEQYHQLWRVDTDFNGVCGLVDDLTPVNSSDLEPMVAMTDGCNAVDRVVSVYPFDVTVTNAIYTSIDLCFLLTDVPEQMATASINLYPSPVAKGNAFTIDMTGASQRVEVFSADGRVMANVPVNSAQRITVGTDGWSAGLYLVRMLNAEGIAISEARIAVQ